MRAAVHHWTQQHNSGIVLVQRGPESTRLGKRQVGAVPQIGQGIDSTAGCNDPYTAIPRRDAGAPAVLGTLPGAPAVQTFELPSGAEGLDAAGDHAQDPDRRITADQAAPEPSDAELPTQGGAVDSNAGPVTNTAMARSAIAGEPSHSTDARRGSGVWYAAQRNGPVAAGSAMTVLTLSQRIAELRAQGVPKVHIDTFCEILDDTLRSFDGSSRAMNDVSVPRSSHLVDAVIQARSASEFEFAWCPHCGYRYPPDGHVVDTVGDVPDSRKEHCPQCGEPKYKVRARRADRARMLYKCVMSHSQHECPVTQRLKWFVRCKSGRTLLHEHPSFSGRDTHRYPNSSMSGGREL